MNGVIDTDGHVFEIDESWEKYADPALGDRWPSLVVRSTGRQVYRFEERYSHTGREVGPPEGTAAARVRDGASNPRSRLEDMDVQGIQIAALFPGFSLRACGWIEDNDLACAVARAYNTYEAPGCQGAQASVDEKTVRLSNGPALGSNCALTSFPIQVLGECPAPNTYRGSIAISHGHR